MSHNSVLNENIEQVVTKRVRCDYDLLQQDIMKLRKQNVLNELEILKLTGKSVIFENQEIIASKVVTEFKSRKIINIMVVSKTQSGKTGSMCATIKQYLEDTSNLMPIEHVYIITGLSSCEWKEQTKERMPESIQTRVFHRCELPNTFVDEIKDKKNILIIMDEIQVAAKKGQTIYKTFMNAGLLNKTKLYKNDIKILEYTATPDGTIYDLMKWNDASSKILAGVGDGYISSYCLYKFGRLLYNEDVLIEKDGIHLTGKVVKTCENDDYTIEYTKENKKCVEIFKKEKIKPTDTSEERLKMLSLSKRVKQYKDLCGYDKETGEINEEVFKNIQEIKNDIDKYPIHLYHIIRTKNGKEQDLTIENFKKIFNIDTYDFITYDRESEIEDINKTLVVEPIMHTFIFIKEMLRCAKTLKKKYIGILYDRYSKNPDDTTIIQGLVGRDTGYDNNGMSICYTNINSIERYEELWKSEFENKNIKWNSKTTKFTNGILSGNNTFNDPKDYSGFSLASSDVSEDIDEPQPIIKRKLFNDIKKWFNDNLKKKGYGNGPNKKNPDKNGFYKCITQFDKVEKIRTNTEFENYEKDKKWGFRGTTEKSKDKNKYRVYPVYKNVNDVESLEWWLIYY